MDLQWKRDMRQGVVTCLCEVGLGCGAFPWIGGAQQEKQMVFGLEGNSVIITIIIINIIIEENTIILKTKVMQKLQYENISCHGALKCYKSNSSNNTILSIYK